MEQSYSQGDISLSPSEILDRLQMLRRLQLLQRGKLHKQQLQYNEGSEMTSSITEVVSHFTNSTSYNTFQSLLQSSEANEMSPQINTSNLPKKCHLQNVIEGVSVLNLSQESEFMTNSPFSSTSTTSSKQDPAHTKTKQHVITLEDIPILSPKKDFEELLTEKLKHETPVKVLNINTKRLNKQPKPFLKKGQGTARFGLQKNDFIIQNTKALPWHKKGLLEKSNKGNNNFQVKINESKPKEILPAKPSISKRFNLDKSNAQKNSQDTESQKDQNLSTKTQINNHFDSASSCDVFKNQLYKSDAEKQMENCGDQNINKLDTKHSVFANKEKTWAAVFTKEQEEFLRKLKQSTYYKNFVSPAKSIVSDVSYDEESSSLKQKREETEQNMFDLIENKVSHESFALDNTFFNRFIKKNGLECSGENTPLILQKCLSKNPNLMHILPDVEDKKQDETCSEVETFDSCDCTECSENSHSISSSCCSCKTVKTTEDSLHVTCKTADKKRYSKEKVLLPREDIEENVQCHNDSVTAVNETMSANLAEMNSKLIATSDLLKERLHELEDEIETFRKENASLQKMREEVDLERQKFYEEKSLFEQKFNEEKILSEYYLAEEKEKLSKQKQIYERHVRDMRGRLNKKEKDEVVNLKKEIHDLKEDVKLKDAKSTSIIARLRNQLRLMEKEKKHLEDEVEKLKKENRRIQHSNEVTRRLTNLKYLEGINKKLSSIATKSNESHIRSESDAKYRSYEIEKQSRNRRPQSKVAQSKVRSKSVPNLNVISRYAKYFSQKDSISDKEKLLTSNEKIDTCEYDEAVTSDNDSNSSNINRHSLDSEDNNLEKLYNERFKSLSPNRRSNTPNSNSANSSASLSSNICNDFFMKKQISKQSSPANVSSEQISKNKSYSIYSNSSISNKHMKSDCEMPYKKQGYIESHIYSIQRNKSPISNISCESSLTQKSSTVINKEQLSNIARSPESEVLSSKKSLSKTNLNPTEIRKPDGTKELKFPNGNVKVIAADGKYSKFIYYNGDIKENFYNEGRIKYYYAETKTYHTTQPDGLEILEFPDGQVEKRYKDGSSEIRLPNGSVRYFDPKNAHVREEWRFPDGAAITISANGEQRIVFPNGQVEVHTEDHKRREFPDGTIKLVYKDGTTETRYASGRVRIKDKHGNLIMDSSNT